MFWQTKLIKRTQVVALPSMRSKKSMKNKTKLCPFVFYVFLGWQFSFAVRSFFSICRFHVSFILLCYLVCDSKVADGNYLCLQNVVGMQFSVDDRVFAFFQ